MSRCKQCGSFAINPSAHGRADGVDLDLCDVCYWRKRAQDNLQDAQRYRKLRAQPWSDGRLAVVRNPKESVRLGAFCPSHELLDAEVDLLEEPK